VILYSGLFGFPATGGNSKDPRAAHGFQRSELTLVIMTVTQML
jgi:hypothetical protein